MALNKATLKNDIINFMGVEGGSSSASDFATNLFNVYESYALGAADLSQDTPLNFPSKSAALSSLAGVMNSISVPDMTNSLAATQLSAALGVALVTFWTTVMFGIAIPMPPMVVEISAITIPPFGNSGVVGPIMIPGLSTTHGDIASAADVWANAMDAFTKTVIVTITGLMPSPTGTIPAVPIIGPII
jgi:hypothetical protein